MDGSIRPRGSLRKTLLHSARLAPDYSLRLRAHIVMLLADGLS